MKAIQPLLDAASVQAFCRIKQQDFLGGWYANWSFIRTSRPERAKKIVFPADVIRAYRNHRAPEVEESKASSLQELQDMRAQLEARRVTGS